MGHIHINPKFAIQPEVIFSVQGTTYKRARIENRLNLSYINIPLNFQYMFDYGYRLQIGPQLGVLSNAKLNAGGSITDSKSNYKSTDIGVTVGMSYVKPETGFGIDLRYNHGLTNVNSDNSILSFNRGVQLGLFYLFGHKS